MISKKNELFEQIRTILEFFRKYWVWITAVIVCLTMTGALYAAFGVSKVYYSSARIYVRPYTGGRGYLSESVQVGEDLTKDGVEIAQSTPVLEKAILNCHLQDIFTAQSLREQMYAYTDYQSRLMTVTVADIDAARAQTLTDAVCQATVKKINNIMDGEWAVIADRADFPVEPEYPILHEIIIQAAVFVLSVFFLIAVLYSMQDHKIRSGEEVKKYLGLALLGSIPKED